MNNWYIRTESLWDCYVHEFSIPSLRTNALNNHCTDVIWRIDTRGFCGRQQKGNNRRRVGIFVFVLQFKRFQRTTKEEPTQPSSPRYADCYLNVTWFWVNFLGRDMISSCQMISCWVSGFQGDFVLIFWVVRWFRCRHSFHNTNNDHLRHKSSCNSCSLVMHPD